MANITLEIPKDLYNQMKLFPYVNWNEVARKSIVKKLEELRQSKNLVKKSKLTNNELILAKKLASASDKDNLYGTEKELFKKLRRK
jgi:hypothetical protein